MAQQPLAAQQPLIDNDEEKEEEAEEEQEEPLTPASIPTSRDFHRLYDTARKIVNLMIQARIIRRSFPCDKIS